MVRDYRQIAQQQATQICSLNTEPCTEKYIKNHAEPGDIVFIDPCIERSICHIAIYVGNNQLVESIGGSGPTIRQIPDYYYPGGKYEIESIYRFPIGRTYAPYLANDVTATFDGAIEPITSFVHSIRPNFRANLDVSLNVYDEIIKTITNPQGLMTQVLIRQYAGEELELAITSEIQRLNLLYASGESELEWSLNCADNYFFEFAEKYTECAHASNECLCSFSIDYREGYNDENIIKFYLDAKGTTLNMGDYNHTIPDEWVYESYVIGDNVLQRVAIEIEHQLRYRNGGFRDAKLIFDARPFEETDAINLYRDADGNMGFLPNEQLAMLNDYEKCIKPEKRAFHFCVDTNQIVQIVNSETEELEDKEVVIRFALQFPEI
jgi:hypothetical protein